MGGSAGGGYNGGNTGNTENFHGGVYENIHGPRYMGSNQYWRQFPVQDQNQFPGLDSTKHIGGGGPQVNPPFTGDGQSSPVLEQPGMPPFGNPGGAIDQSAWTAPGHGFNPQNTQPFGGVAGGLLGGRPMTTPSDGVNISDPNQSSHNYGWPPRPWPQAGGNPKFRPR